MRQGIFKRIFILYGVIFALAVLGSEVYITAAVRTNRINALRDDLTVRADLVARDIDFTSSAQDGRCRQLKTIVRARVTIISPDGRVLGDSDHDSATMDNHRSRVEVQQADLNGTGTTLRRSDTLKYDLLYVARKVVRDGRFVGFVRLSVPLQDIDSTVKRLRVNSIAAITAILLAAGLLSLWQIRRLHRLTIQVRDFASALARGDLGKRLFLHRAGEFEEIAGGLNNMALALQNEVQSLRDEKAKFETALLGISDGVLLLNQEGRVELANRVFHDMFDISSDISGKPFLEVVRNHLLADMVRRAHVDHLAASGEIDLETPKQMHLFATALPIIQESMRDDRYRGTVVALHDITQLKKLEQVRKDFVANVSHELRTPITAIQGFAETLLDGALEDRENARQFIGTIKANSQRINSLVDDLMTISKIELGVITVEKTDVAFQDAAEAVLSLLRDKARKKGIGLVASIPPDAAMIRADRDRLIQILMNLVENAIKFTEKGGVTVGIGDDGGRTFLFVEDTGIGIPEKHLPRIGERFYRVDAARSRNMGGTGLGLAIVKHLVKAHGWEMQIESRLGKGTTVKIYVA
jgi:two-component system phosphate regulon sensor histidine kinase PhoR